MSEFTPDDASFLIGRGEFRRFMFAAIQSAGILNHNPLADGREGRDLSIAEGRRSLGFELLSIIDAGQPEVLRTPHALATFEAIIRETMNPAPNKEKARGRRTDDTSRYDDITD